MLECLFFAMSGDQILADKGVKYKDLLSNFRSNGDSRQSNVVVSIWMKLTDPGSLVEDSFE